MLFSFLLKLYKPMDMTEGEPEECSFPNCTLAPENGSTTFHPEGNYQAWQ